MQMQRPPTAKLSGYHLYIGAATPPVRRGSHSSTAVPIECARFLKALPIMDLTTAAAHRYVDLPFLAPEDIGRTSKLLAEYLRHELGTLSSRHAAADVRDGPRFETVANVEDPTTLVANLHPRDKWYVDFVQKLSLLQLQSIWKVATELQITGLQMLCERQAAQMMVMRAQQQASFANP